MEKIKRFNTCFIIVIPENDTIYSRAPPVKEDYVYSLNCRTVRKKRWYETLDSIDRYTATLIICDPVNWWLNEACVLTCTLGGILLIPEI